MITTPITPVTAAPASWLSVHAARIERVVIVSLVLLVGTFGISRYLDSRVVATAARATVAEQALKAEQTKDAENSLETSQQLAQYQSELTADHALVASLASAVAQRQATVVAHQTTDSTLKLPDLANRLKTLGNAPEGSVSTNAVSQVILTQPGALAVTQTLEQVPALQGDLKDTQTALSSSQAALAQAGKAIDAQTAEIAGLKLTITGEETQCKAQVATVKAQARRSKWRSFLAGFVLGFVGRSAIH